MPVPLPVSTTCPHHLSLARLPLIHAHTSHLVPFLYPYNQFCRLLKWTLWSPKMWLSFWARPIPIYAATTEISACQTVQTERQIQCMVHTNYNLNVTRVDHEMLTQFCCKRVTLCVVSSEPRPREKHELCVHVYTFLLHVHTCIGYTCTQYNLRTELQYGLIKYLHCYINLQFFSVFTSLTYVGQFTCQQ